MDNIEIPKVLAEDSSSDHTLSSPDDMNTRDSDNKNVNTINKTSFFNDLVTNSSELVNGNHFENSPALTNLRKIADIRGSSKSNFENDSEMRNDILHLKNKMDIINRINVDLLNRIEELEIYADDLYDTIEGNRVSINNLQAYSRRENIELVGIPDNIGMVKLESKLLEILRSLLN